MKLCFMFFFILISSQSHGTDYCSAGTALYAIESKGADQDVILFEIPKVMSEHLGKVDGIAAKSENLLVSLKIEGELIPVKVSKEGIFTTHFSLFDFLEKRQIQGIFKVEFIGANNFHCYREYEVISGD